VKARGEIRHKSTPAPPEPRVQQQFVRRKNTGSSAQTTTHHHGDGAAFNTNLHAINNSQGHDSSASERIMSQSNSDLDPKSTDEREEEHEIKHFALDKRGDCIDNFITYTTAGFKPRPSYEEILQHQDDSSEQLEITAMIPSHTSNCGTHYIEPPR
jgi:hypothetical protein